MKKGRGEGGGERESQVDSSLSMEPEVGLDLRPWDHDLNENQELDA